MNRTPENAALHDRVISELVKVLNQKDYDIYTNPGQDNKYHIGDNYPDLLMTRKGDRTVRFILEVETQESVIIDEALSQWKKYALEIKSTFYLVVPVNSLKRAQELCQQVGINVRYATYSVGPDMSIVFNFN